LAVIIPRTAEQLRDDALAIWRAGVAAVQPAQLVPEFVQVEGGELWIADDAMPLKSIRRIAVVGGGKASAAMAAALEAALGADVLTTKSVEGWVNVPAGAFVPTQAVHLHAARPQGVNEPTAEGAAGVEEILRLVAGLGPDDLCFCLLSGGGSALLPAPIEGVSLAEKVTLTRELSARGATIHELNAVRRALSAIKGGGLARACGAGRLVSLILSDVPGDDLDTIASGPTVLGPASPQEAVAVLRRFSLDQTLAGRAAIAAISRRGDCGDEPRGSQGSVITNLVIGNNAAAVDGAGVEAERRGYSHAMTSATAPEGPVEGVARHLVAMAERMRCEPGPDCLITGGEPTVELAPVELRGRGGRNQQLALLALAELADWRGLALVSGGTDGEDGPTDAAGAWVDERVAENARRQGLDVADSLARNDAYRFFERAGGLLVTGPTQTNVCDLRVVTVSR
jgi:glycerate 2-kinase